MPAIPARNELLKATGDATTGAHTVWETYTTCCAARETFGNQAGHNTQPLDSDRGQRVSTAKLLSKHHGCRIPPRTSTGLEPHRQNN